MTCTKQITLTGYRVRYADLRQPKPRPILEDVQVLDRDALTALGLLGMNPADFIEDRFTRGGFHVISVERLPKRAAAVDLLALWDNAKQEGAANV